LKRLLQKLLYATDSPTLTRDMQSLLSAWRVGVWFLLLNLTLGITLAIFIFLSIYANDNDFISVVEGLGLGQFLTLAVMGGIGALCTIFIPLRASGLFEGARWARIFDQIISSGISPLRYFFGKIAAQNVFFGLIILAAFPYIIFCLSFDYGKLGFFITSLLLLWVYANVLTLVTLASSIFKHEIMAVLGVIIAYGLCYLIACWPLPPVLALVSPATHFLSPVWNIMVERNGSPPWGDCSSLDFAVSGWQISLGSAELFLLGSLATAVVCLGVMLVGPVQCLNKHNSTFGEVVMPGDCKRKSMFRRRFALCRQAEMSFFYENRSDWIKRWEGVIRHVGLFGGLTTLAIFAFAGLHLFRFSLRAHEFFVVNLVILCCGLIVGIYSFCSDRGTELTPLGFGKWKFPAGRADTIAFLLFVVVLLALAKLLPWLRNMPYAQVWGWDQKRATMYDVLRVVKSFYLIPLFTFLALQFYALTRWFSLQAWDRRKAFIAAFVMAQLLWFMPFIAGLMIFKVYRDEVIPLLGLVSKICLNISVVGMFYRTVELETQSRDDLYIMENASLFWGYFFHGLVLAVMMVLIHYSRKKLTKIQLGVEDKS